MSSKYREIEEKGQNHDNYHLDLFNALQTVPNPDFAAFVRDERQAWEIGGDKSSSQLIAESFTIYNNAVSANRWESKDPKDAKIMALTTQVEQLVEALTTQKTENKPGCPLIWASRMETEIALSTAEFEYIACSMTMRDVLSTMQIMEEIDKIFPLVKVKPKVHCKVYEDNESYIAIAKNRKFSPRTKHIAIKYHHFRRHVNKSVTLHSIDTNEQIADAWTIPLEQPQFEYLRKKYCGW